jgi:hypothetical protein
VRVAIPALLHVWCCAARGNVSRSNYGSSAEAPARHFGVLKLWKSSKQPPHAGVTYMDIANDEVLVAVDEEKHGWFEVERTDGPTGRASSGGSTGSNSGSRSGLDSILYT